MFTVAQLPLFSWGNVERSPEILRLKRVLDVMPDEELMIALRKDRAGKRDDYPVHVLWNTLLAAVIFGHETVASLRRELFRNAELREVCGCEAIQGQELVPPEPVYSRFFVKLFRHADLIEAMFKKLVDRLAELLPDYGQELAVDGKALPTWGRKDAEADWGAKTQRGTKKDGTPFENLKRWFGYKLHLMVDVNYELPVAFELTRSSVAESPRLMPMVEKFKEEHPRVYERAKSLAANRGYDDGADKAKLWDEHQIVPLIDTRNMRQEQGGSRMRPLDEKRSDTIYTSGTGEVCCKVDPFAAQEEKKYAAMAFMGFEKDRGTLKFRCPAAAYGLECRNREACRCAPLTRDGDYGRVMRIKLDEQDRRLFMPAHRHSRTFEKGYNKRSAIERVNSRLDQVYGFERHAIKGMKKMKLRVSLAMMVMLATAVAWIEIGEKQKMRSLLLAA
jgi:hypothetical protein